MPKYVVCLFVCWITMGTWTKREKWNANKKGKSEKRLSEKLIDWILLKCLLVRCSPFFSFPLSHSPLSMIYWKERACFVHIAISIRWFILFWIIMSVLFFVCSRMVWGLLCVIEFQDRFSIYEYIKYINWQSTKTTKVYAWKGLWQNQIDWNQYS